MKIGEVYKKFGISPNLQEHMLRVYGIECFLENHWTGDKIDWNIVKKVALLHDIGNIVKFRLDGDLSLLGEEAKNVEFWRMKQQQVISEYGNDDESVTQKMLDEIGANDEVKKIIADKAFGNSVAVSKSNNWHLKLLYYADLRTLPLGIGSLEDRLNDVRARMPKYTSRPDFEDLVKSCLEIGKQIEANIDVSPDKINDGSIKINKETLEAFEV